MVLGQVLVEQAEPADHRAALVGEHGVADAVLFGEGGENLDRVIAQRENGDSLLLEVGQAALQLDELRSTEGSPAGAALKGDQRPLARTSGVEVHQAAMLVGQGHIREGEPDLWADMGKVNGGEFGRLGGHTELAPGTDPRDPWPGRPPERGVWV